MMYNEPVRKVGDFIILSGNVAINMKNITYITFKQGFLTITSIGGDKQTIEIGAGADFFKLVAMFNTKEVQS